MSDTRTSPYRTRTHTAPRKRRQAHRTTRHAVRRTLHCHGELPGGIAVKGMRIRLWEDGSARLRFFNPDMD